MYIYIPQLQCNNNNYIAIYADGDKEIIKIICSVGGIVAAVVMIAVIVPAVIVCCMCKSNRCKEANGN